MSRGFDSRESERYNKSSYGLNERRYRDQDYNPRNDYYLNQRRSGYGNRENFSSYDNHSSDRNSNQQSGYYRHNGSNSRDREYSNGSRRDYSTRSDYSNNQGNRRYHNSSNDDITRQRGYTGEDQNYPTRHENPYRQEDSRSQGDFRRYEDSRSFHFSRDQNYRYSENSQRTNNANYKSHSRNKDISRRYSPTRDSFRASDDPRNHNNSERQHDSEKHYESRRYSPQPLTRRDSFRTRADSRNHNISDWQNDSGRDYEPSRNDSKYQICSSYRDESSQKGYQNQSPAEPRYSEQNYTSDRGHSSNDSYRRNYRNDRFSSSTHYAPPRSQESSKEQNGRSGSRRQDHQKIPHLISPEPSWMQNVPDLEFEEDLESHSDSEDTLTDDEELREAVIRTPEKTQQTASERARIGAGRAGRSESLERRFTDLLSRYPFIKDLELVRRISNPEDVNPHARYPCVFCGGRHLLDSCPKETDVEERRLLLQIGGHCTICLGKHGKQSCRREVTCRYCDEKQDHASCLCPTPRVVFDQPVIEQSVETEEVEAPAVEEEVKAETTEEFQENTCKRSPIRSYANVASKLRKQRFTLDSENWNEPGPADNQKEEKKKIGPFPRKSNQRRNKELVKASEEVTGASEIPVEVLEVSDVDTVTGK